MLRFIIQLLSRISYLMFVFILFVFCVQIVNNEMLPQKSSRGKTSPLLDELYCSPLIKGIRHSRTTIPTIPIIIPATI